jgi:hypothetical protein
VFYSKLEIPACIQWLTDFKLGARVSKIHDRISITHALVFIILVVARRSSRIKGQATLTPAQAQQWTAGEWYINVHTQANPNGEIRGQVLPPKS